MSWATNLLSSLAVGVDGVASLDVVEVGLRTVFEVVQVVIAGEGVPVVLVIVVVGVAAVLVKLVLLVLVAVPKSAQLLYVYKIHTIPS